MRRILSTIGMLVLAAVATGIGVFGGYVLDTVVPGPKSLDEMLNRGAEITTPRSYITLDPEAELPTFYQTKDDAQVRICRLVDPETLEAECGPWTDQ